MLWSSRVPKSFLFFIVFFFYILNWAVKVGDVITGINDETIHDPNAIMTALSEINEAMSDGENSIFPPFSFRMHFESSEP